MKTKLILLFLIIGIWGFLKTDAKPSADDLYSRLKKLKGIYVKKLEPLPGFKEGYEIAFAQPVDHKNPNGAKFMQRIFVSHRDYSKLVVLETDGYGVPWHKEREVAKILNANQILVEHRYFESSKPKPLDWKYLTSWQAASDHHRIVEIFKKIYPGKWISSGRSKGGMAALFHRAFYPDDVNATLTYVSPIMIGPTDPRIEKFLNSVGDEESHNRIQQFQRTCLEHKNEILPLLKSFSENQKLTYSYSFEDVFVQAVLEFPYSFWSGNHKIEQIPNQDATVNDIFNFLNKVNSFLSLSTAQIKSNAALYYQQYTELGYFDYQRHHLSDLVDYAGEPCFLFYVPKDAQNAIFSKEAMVQVSEFLKNEGNNIIYLYGEFDIWTSCAVELAGKTNAIKLILKDKAHQFNIEDFPVDEKQLIYEALEDWLQVKIIN